MVKKVEQLRIGILDYYNLQQAERSGVVFNVHSNIALRKRKKGMYLIADEIRKLGHKPVIYHPENCQIFFDNNSSEILYKGKKIKGCDVLIPRIDVVKDIELELSFIKQFQLMGIPLVNKYLPISQAMNKLRAMQILTKVGIPVPKTIVVRKFEFLDDCVKAVGGYPVIIKAPFGTHGKGVTLIESRRSLYSTLDILWKFTRSSITLIQEYVAEASGCDYRVIVVGGKVVAAMKRIARVGDFRSNLSLGGVAEKVVLTPLEKKIAVKASEALGLEISGVDILRSKEGPLVMEINPCPGLLGVSQATSVNVAEHMVKYAVDKVHSLNISK